MVLIGVPSVVIGTFCLPRCSEIKVVRLFSACVCVCSPPTTRVSEHALKELELTFLY